MKTHPVKKVRIHMSKNSTSPASGPNEPPRLALSGQTTANQITADTPLPEGGTFAWRLVFDAAADIEVLANEVISRADELEPAEGVVIRALVVRIHAMNSILLSYIGNDDLTIGDAHREIYGANAELPEGVLQ